MKFSKVRALGLGLLACTSLALAPSCHIAAAVGLGVVISQEFSENAHSLRLPGNFEQAWDATYRTLENMSLDPVQVDREQGRMQAHVQGTSYTCQITAHDAYETVLAVTAKSLGRYENETAQALLFKVRKRMGGM
ncbi:MAG: hypothetical protein P1V35_09665 [Planctomycetota bacterium]|nr:hypothetical protein [Planctomycetota bacterium]